MDTTGKKILLFDGVCNLCNSSVDFIIRKDKKKQFHYGSLQGGAGKELLKQFSLPSDEMNSLILIEDHKIYTHSTGVLRICKHLGHGWQLLHAFIIVPRFIRDGIYKWISRKRYQWFGKRSECRLPTPEEKKYFLD